MKLGGHTYKNSVALTRELPSRRCSASRGYTLGRKKGYDHTGALTLNMASLGLTNPFVDADPMTGDPGLWRRSIARPAR